MKGERQAVLVTCSRCGRDSKVLEGSEWAVRRLCTPCALQTGQTRDGRYRAIFQPSEGKVPEPELSGARA